MEDNTWKELKNEQDIEHFLNQFGGFHDGCLKELRYVSGQYVDHDFSLYPINSTRNLYVIFQRQWRNPAVIEMLFEQLECLSLKPPDQNFASFISSAYMAMEDGCFVWFDNSEFQEDYKELYNSPETTWIKAQKVKWRVAEECLGDTQVYHI